MQTTACGLLALSLCALLALPAAARVRACANQDLVVTKSDQKQAKKAFACLVNAVRARYGLPAISESAQLNSFAKAHPNPTTAPPRWGQSFVAPNSEGDQTAYAAIAFLMRGQSTCSAILGGYSSFGVGLVNKPQTSPVDPIPAPIPLYVQSPAWTIVLANRIGSNHPSIPRTGRSCPHQLPIDAAGQGEVKTYPLGLYDAGANEGTVHGNRVTLVLLCAVSEPCTATLTLKFLHGGANATSAPIGANVAAHSTTSIEVPVDSGALRRAERHGAPLAVVSAKLVAPTRITTLYELHLKT